MQLEWGEKIIQAVKQLDGLESTILIVRHSERPSLEGVPYEQWNSVDLTQRGIEAARRFGNVLTSDDAKKTNRTHHWGSKRCATTADAISNGARETGCRVQGPIPIPLKSPILDAVEYRKDLLQNRWKAFMMKWLDSSKTQSAMIPAIEFAKDIFASLLEAKPFSAGEAMIIATHDIHVIPLISYVFRPNAPWVDYLDGLVMKKYPDNVALSFNNDVRQLSLEELKADGSGLEH